MNRHRLFIPLLSALALAACEREPRPYVDNFTYTDTSTYTDTAQAIRAAAGSQFQIRIRSNQSTGYQWVLVDSAALDGVRVMGTVYRVPPELAGRGGAGGAETWTLQALRPGEHTLSMISVRPWENTAPRDTTRFRVIIE
jgi:predicted secreted protein